MSIWGKIIGASAGLALGGPLGALLGGLVGAAFDAAPGGWGDVFPRMETDKPPRSATRQIGFTIGVIALAAKMAKADGHVTHEEIVAFRQVFQVPPQEMGHVGRIFDLAREHTAGFEAYARQLARLLRREPLVLQDLLEALFFIAQADGELHPAEIDYLRRVAEIFNLDKTHFKAMMARHAQVDYDPYAILGIQEGADKETVKKAYRQKMREVHPDILIASGVPPELIAVANRRASAVNEAYQQIMARYLV